MAWKRIAMWADLEQKGCLAFTADGQRVALFAVEGRAFALADMCTHQLAYLSEGFVEGDCVECPMHQGRFHIPTGRALCAPLTEDVAVFAARIEGGAVYVDL